MSNNVLNDSKIETAAVGTAVPTPARHRFRRTWILSGLVLWGLVFVAAAGLFLLKHRGRVAKDAESGSAVVDLEKAGGNSPISGKGAQEAGEKRLKPLLPWNPAGVEDFVFTERSGKKVTKADLLGHPWLVSFIFTRCAGPCPRVSTQMSELQTLLKGSDVRLVTLTVDPDFDSADVLKRYAESYHADANRWLYLTGDKRKTYQLINNSFLMPVQEYTGKDREPGFEVMHSTNILLVNEKGVVVNKYNAVDEADMSRLRHDLKPYLKAKPG